MKRHFLEECYAKITEAAHCYESRRQADWQRNTDWSLETWVLLDLSSSTWGRVLSF